MRNIGKEGKKTAKAMHQSNFSSQKDLLWSGSLFYRESKTQTTYTQTLIQAERSKGERWSLQGPKNGKT